MDNLDTPPDGNVGSASDQSFLSLAGISSLLGGVAPLLRDSASNTNGQTVKAPNAASPAVPGTNNLILYIVLGAVAFIGLIFVLKK